MKAQCAGYGGGKWLADRLDGNARPDFLAKAARFSPDRGSVGPRDKRNPRSAIEGTCTALTGTLCVVAALVRVGHEPCRDRPPFVWASQCARGHHDAGSCTPLQCRTSPAMGHRGLTLFKIKETLLRLHRTVFVFAAFLLRVRVIVKLLLDVELELKLLVAPLVRVAHEVQLQSLSPFGLGC